MAWPGTLTAEEQETLLQWTVQLRAYAGALYRLGKNGEAVDNMYNAETSALLGELAGADEIPNASGYDGAAPLTKDEVITLVSYVQGVETNYGTVGHEQALIRAAGTQEVI